MNYGQLCTEFYDTDKQFASNEELQLYQELFDKNDLLLEPMCGSGRLLLPLMQLGYLIHGIDRSPYMLRSCRERAAKLDLNPILHQGNVEDYPLDQKYTGVIIPYGSFQLFNPRENACRVLEKFKQLLLPGGKLVIDLFVPWEALYEHGEIYHSVRRVELSTHLFIEIKNETIADKNQQHMLSKIHYAKYENGQIIAEENEQMDVLWYYAFEMELLLEKYGYKHIKRVDRFLNNSEHMTFIATDEA